MGDMVVVADASLRFLVGQWERWGTTTGPGMIDREVAEEVVGRKRHSCGELRPIHSHERSPD